jgi:hypothetical protein
MSTLEKRDRRWEFRDHTLIEPASGRTATVAVASPVRWGHVPKWLKKRLAPHQLDLTCYTDAHPLLKGADWLDHWGTAIEGGAEVFVSEPYQLTAEGMHGLLHFATILDLYLIVRASSAYYPTYSLRITLMEQ